MPSLEHVLQIFILTATGLLVVVISLFIVILLLIIIIELYFVILRPLIWMFYCASGLISGFLKAIFGGRK